MNNETLFDILQSHLTLYGDKQITIRPALPIRQTLDCFIRDVPIIRCLPSPYMEQDKQTISDIIDRIRNLPEEAPVTVYSFDLHGLKKFQIGFQTEDDGFVEIINRKELNVVRENIY